jgi:hypothetical protein
MISCNMNIIHQSGQAMAEYMVVVVFGVMVLIIGPAGDVLLDLLFAMNDNYQGYSYAASLSTLPDHDNLAEYVLEISGLNPAAVEAQLSSLLNQVPSSMTLPDIGDIPLNKNTILEGATSLW